MHTNKASETMERLENLIIRYLPNYVRGSTKGFDTIVYMHEYKIEEILEVEGFDKVTGNYIYEKIF